MKEEATLSDFVDEIATQVCEVYQKYQLTQSSQFEHFQSLRMLDKIKRVTPCLTHHRVCWPAARPPTATDPRPLYSSAPLRNSPQPTTKFWSKSRIL